MSAELPVLSEKHVEEFTGICGDAGHALFIELLEIFQRTAPETLFRVLKGIEQVDFEEMGQAAHKLKGSSANIGALRLSDTCGEIEKAARNSDAVSLVALVDRVKTDFKELTHDIEDYLAE